MKAPGTAWGRVARGPALGLCVCAATELSHTSCSREVVGPLMGHTFVAIRRASKWHVRYVPKADMRSSPAVCRSRSQWFWSIRLIRKNFWRTN